MVEHVLDACADSSTEGLLREVAQPGKSRVEWRRQADMKDARRHSAPFWDRKA
jgi:hypothetical protein